MIRIPNGLANFSEVRADNCFYLDRTHYIEQLETYASRFSTFLRPRRFGKSLFISILEHYYDVNKAAEFSLLFGDLYIGKHPVTYACNTCEPACKIIVRPCFGKRRGATR
jgi:hypothetical protein